MDIPIADIPEAHRPPWLPTDKPYLTWPSPEGATVAEVEALMQTGMTWYAMAAAFGIDHSTLYAWRAKQEKAGHSFEQATMAMYEAMIDWCVKIPYHESDAPRARIKADVVYRAAEMRFPSRFGKRVGLEVTGTISLRAAIEDARKRVWSQAIDVTPQRPTLPSDSLSLGSLPLLAAKGAIGIDDIL